MSSLCLQTERQRRKFVSARCDTEAQPLILLSSWRSVFSLTLRLSLFFYMFSLDSKNAWHLLSSEFTQVSIGPGLLLVRCTLLRSLTRSVKAIKMYAERHQQSVFQKNSVRRDCTELLTLPNDAEGSAGVLSSSLHPHQHGSHILKQTPADSSVDRHRHTGTCTCRCQADYL